MRAPQQKAGQSEEHRNCKIESAESSSDCAGLGFASLERNVCYEDTKRRKTSHTVQSGHEAASLRRN